MSFIFSIPYSSFFTSLALFLLLSNSSPGQNRQTKDVHAVAQLDSLHKKATRYFENYPLEKVYVHFDKPFYITGEISWYQAYIVSEGDFGPTDISSVLNVDWIDPSGKIIKHQRLRIEDGRATGDFTIDTTLSGGTYTVRAYTNWMRNDHPDIFFYKNIQVYNTRKISSRPADTSSPTIDLQFFPEGGTLVAGVNTQIAFKAIDQYGMGVDVSGTIMDEQNNILGTIQSRHKGMGTFPFVPVANKLFRVVLQNGDAYPLPPALDKGLVLSAYNMYPDKILIRIQAPKEQSNIYLLGQSRGSISYASHIKMDGNTKDLSIAKDQLPEGVFQLTLFDSKGIPQCERKLFIKKPSSFGITIRSDKEKYTPRDSIVLSFNVADSKGRPAQTSLSVSVTDANFTGKINYSENIYTSLLLQADMKGNIENPTWYFDSSTATKEHALDMVMLTHGWSRYHWEKILAAKEKQIAFMPENGITLEGEILANNKPVLNTNFLMMIRQAGNEHTDIYQTDSLGRFLLPDLVFFDSTLVSFRVMTDKRVIENAKIRFTSKQSDVPDVTRGALSQFGDKQENELGRTLIGQEAWKPDNYKMLEEVVVTARAKKIRTVGMGAKLVKPDAIDLKGRVSTAQFIGRYAMGLPFSKLRTMPDGTEAWTGGVIFIDGFQADNTGFGGNPILILNGIPIEDIEHVVVNSKRGAYFIAITTKRPDTQRSGTISLMAKGYDEAREFYHPKYGPLDSSSTFPDTRITLYWNADLQTDESGRATVKFYNADYARRLHIVAEGIINGAPVSITRIVGK